MSRSPRLTVVAPEFTDASASIRGRRDVLYARLAGRGSVQRKWQANDVQGARLMPWQRGLLAAIALDERTHPSAPLTASSAGLDLEHSWLHAELVHFAAGLNEVALVSLTGEHAVGATERDELFATLRAHVGSTSLLLEATPAGKHLLRAPHVLDVQTVTPQFARTQEWNVALPRGRDAGMLRRLMTEWQMLLHEHPVNLARMARGVPPANAVWLWGGGEVASGARTDAPVCIGDNDYLAGVCRCEHWRAPRAIAETEQILSDIDSSANVVIALSEDASLEAQLQVSSLGVAALQTGRIRALELVLDEWQVSVDRWSLRKFWRAPRTIEQWAPA